MDERTPIKILLVEDNASHIRAIERAFSATAVFESVGSLAEFHRKIKIASPDVVLMDLNLSDGSAIDVLKAISEPVYPLLVMTSHGNEEMAVTAMKAGALDYVVKSPESFVAMPQIVQRAMREWRLVQDKKQAEVALVEREHQLRIALEAAEAASRSKSEFLANMSHEIRTPLSGVFGLLQYLKTTPLLGEQTECIDLALESGQTLLQILNDLLDLSRIEAGYLDLYRDPFDPTKLVGQVNDIFLPTTAAKNLILHTELSENFPRQVIGDEGRLRQVLFNLVGNAVKFTETGSITISAKMESVSTRPDKQKLCFSVQDTGIGIAPDKLDLIFEPFVQADGSSTRKYGGAGLGLGIVKRLIALMNGRLSIESELGQGTKISFFVDVDWVNAEAGQVVQSPADSITATGCTLKILLAEDDRVNRLTLERLLAKQGHMVRSVPDGRQCLEALQEEPFDLVLMDIQMPVMDGQEATRHIRDLNHPDKRNIPIIALTAHAMKGDREKFLACGMDDYLSKPVRMEQVRGILARYFQ